LCFFVVTRKMLFNTPIYDAKRPIRLEIGMPIDTSKHMTTDVASPAILETVERAVADLRRGGTVVITSVDQAALVRAAETIDDDSPPFFNQPGVDERVLAVTGRRAAILGLGKPNVRTMILKRRGGLPATTIINLIDPDMECQTIPPPNVKADAAPEASCADAAVLLTKIARLLPAVLLAPLTVEDPVTWARASGRLVVASQSITLYEKTLANALQAVSEARVPLEGCENTRLITFRPKDGGVEHLAVIVGEPNPEQAVLTRLHSECFTGDLLGSLRCDCGDQLRGAIEMIATEGNGILLYLAQEGRGIGLVNKLRAYQIQDKGFDTVDANEQLGFDDDERVYLPAVQMLNQLGFTKVRLLTNNPAKVGALARHGIEVTKRVPHVFPSNEHNKAYLQAKVKRSGHLF